MGAAWDEDIVRQAAQWSSRRLIHADIVTYSYDRPAPFLVGGMIGGWHIGSGGANAGAQLSTRRWPNAMRLLKIASMRDAVCQGRP